MTTKFSPEIEEALLSILGESGRKYANIPNEESALSLIQHARLEFSRKRIAKMPKSGLTLAQMGDEADRCDDWLSPSSHESSPDTHLVDKTEWE